MEQYRKTIADEFEDCINRAIQRLSNERTRSPFHEALLSEEAIFWSRFERSFSSSFGARVIQRLSKIAALVGGASQAETLRQSTFSLSASQLQGIEAHISDLRLPGRQVGWEKDIAYLREIPRSGPVRQVRVISDVWWVKDGVQHFMSIKTVKPNIDQTVEAKRDLVKLTLHDPAVRVFFGLYYNPYGSKRSDYAWAPPQRIFDFQHDSVVLIGQDYWDTLGGAGFYDEVLAIAEEVGKKTRPLLQRLPN